MNDLSHCRTCGAPIEWAITTKARARIPLDLGGFPTGNLRIEGYTEQDEPIVRVLPLDEARSSGELLRRSHFVSCPDAEVWRR